MSGTDKSRNQATGPSPVVVLVNPQLGENIGTAARAMANFGLHEMRIVEPRDGWPNKKAFTASSGAHWILEGARVFETLPQAMADMNFGWTVEMQVKAARAGLTCLEVPVSYKRRIGRSKVSGTIRGVIGAGTKILYVIGREALVRTPPHEKPATARNNSPRPDVG
ncbi:MAG: hypothetical protein HC774_07240 [Sphingomonadales bacterium]|nr:hypothetical protein [Sphingomonadales bacterium]